MASGGEGRRRGPPGQLGNTRVTFFPIIDIGGDWAVRPNFQNNLVGGSAAKRHQHQQGSRQELLGTSRRHGQAVQEHPPGLGKR
jgi:hypothetical protein